MNQKQLCVYGAQFVQNAPRATVNRDDKKRKGTNNQQQQQQQNFNAKSYFLLLPKLCIDRISECVNFPHLLWDIHTNNFVGCVLHESLSLTLSAAPICKDVLIGCDKMLSLFLLC